MGSSKSEAEYNAFLEKVQRTIYIDNLSPHATDKVLKAAFDQFGCVVSIQFIPNFFEPKNLPVSALVEMESAKQAQGILAQMENNPFMVLGMPRPVRSRPARPEMFEDRPRKPGRKIFCRWVDPKEPDFEVAKKLKHLVRKHSAEASLLLEHQMAEEEKLAKQQSELLKSQYKKFELLESVFMDGTAKNLARKYDMSTDG
ncbi:RNA-binding (RRM/RBD/RNP motifs) family protein [Striga hermonthica]|uniref:RNA-binding (RRM/RBD/RNP motifs) family protein n=1 Tax=Striga hermonthica TaxID=68872 RepID=A0A9N7RAL9_STRHE|nr:RNA-binding (RRM/RBD/RNP motifs) family protein [Striga hermonthica]